MHVCKRELETCSLSRGGDSREDWPTHAPGTRAAAAPQRRPAVVPVHSYSFGKYFIPVFIMYSNTNFELDARSFH
jgi:hypothetical protein